MNSREELSRTLSVGDAVALFVGIILGSGIFVAPAAVAAAAPSAWGGVALWLLGGVVTICGALCYAECAARFPKDGGFYVFYHAAFGEPLAFVGGWIALFVTYPASVAAIARIFGGYLSETGDAARGIPVGVSATVAIAFAGALNVVGVRAGATAQRVLTASKVVALGGLCAAALVAARSLPLSASVPATSAVWLAPAFLAAGTAVLWTYDGWTDVTLASGELRDPGRNLLRAVLLGTVVLVCLYAAVQLSVSALLTPAEAAASPRVFTAAVERGLGGSAGRVVALLVVVSTLGSVNGIVLAVSRLAFAMAGDGSFFRWFGQVHPRFLTPARAVLAVAVSSIFYVWAARFQALLNYFSFCVWIFYGLTAVALLRFRRRGMGAAGARSLRTGPLPPLVIVAVAAGMTFGQLAANPRESAYGLLMIAAGFASYYAWRTLRRRLAPGPDPS